MNISFEDMDLEELESKALEFRQQRDSITNTLRLIVSEIDKRKATESVKEIVSGLSDEQKREMYAQLVGVSTASSVGVSHKGVKSNG